MADSKSNQVTTKPNQVRTKSIPEDEDWRPEILVIGPDGIKGFYYCGALSYLESESILDNVHTIVGCSIGAIIGLLINCSYSIIEITSEAADINLFDDLSSINVDNIKRGVGLMSNQALREKMTKLVMKKFGNDFDHVPTLSELYLKTGLRFCVISHNLSKRKVAYLNANTEPDISCVEAVLLSANIPLIFHKARYNGDIYIDGAFVNPYPIDYFDDENLRTLGMFVDSVVSDSDLTGISLRDLLHYVSSIAYASIGQIRSMIIRSVKSDCRHLMLTTPVTGLSSDDRDKSRMIADGSKKAREFHLNNFRNSNIEKRT
jgi:predicted acylesterase/phospholipase RssA